MFLSIYGFTWKLNGVNRYSNSQHRSHIIIFHMRLATTLATLKPSQNQGLVPGAACPVVALHESGYIHSWKGRDLAKTLPQMVIML